MEHNTVVYGNIADEYFCRSSATLEICAGEIGLTEKQQIEYDTLVKRNLDYANKVDKVKPLTDNMVKTLAALQYKKDNPELPEGAKTHCKKWLNERLYGRRPEIKSKYIDKGNTSEEEGFTLMALELNLGMVYKNNEVFSNKYQKGTPDLIANQIVYDNKCSWSLDTFPMWETELPDEKYEWQVNSYDTLVGVKKGCVCYTLIDAEKHIVEREIKWCVDPDEAYRKTMNLVFTKTYFDELKAEFFPASTLDCFIEIPQEKRIKPFYITLDPAKIAKIEQRVPMCRAYINELLKLNNHVK